MKTACEWCEEKIEIIQSELASAQETSDNVHERLIRSFNAMMGEPTDRTLAPDISKLLYSYDDARGNEVKLIVRDT